MDEVNLVESAERALSPYYQGERALKRLFGNAGVAVVGVDLAGGDLPELSAGLRHADGLHMLDKVIEAALRDHKDDAALIRLHDVLVPDRPTTTKITDLVGRLSGFQVLLRHSRHLARDEIEQFDAILQEIFDLTATIGDSPLRDVGSNRWPELQQALRNCLQHFQLYRELLDTSAKIPRWRVPGAPEVRLPLAEIAADRMALIDAKLQLFDAITEVVTFKQATD
jgi:hypothetical protein